MTGTALAPPEVLNDDPPLTAVLVVDDGRLLDIVTVTDLVHLPDRRVARHRPTAR